MEKIRVIELPRCKMASSGCDTASDFAPGSVLGRFSQWFDAADAQRRDKFYPRDFLWYDEVHGGFAWYYAIEDGMDAGGYDLVDFPGGLYAVATAADGEGGDNALVDGELRRWAAESGCFEADDSRRALGHIITPPAAIEAMGYAQLDHYFPIKVKK